MFGTIIEKLKEIESVENVRILHAVESGSRAWGFASATADYDVRFIYVRPKEFYLRLDKTRDVIEWQLDGILDINGWDLQKALRLLRTSNPALFEWNSSPVIYITTEEWSLVSKEIKSYFLVKPGLYHYLSTATNNYREYLKNDIVKLKKYFYVIRPLLACKWIINHKCPPPVKFKELVDAELENEMYPIINDLLEKKMSLPELGEGHRVDKLNEYIDKYIISLKNIIEVMPNEKKPDWNKLNQLFLDIVL